MFYNTQLIVQDSENKMKKFGIHLLHETLQCNYNLRKFSSGYYLLDIVARLWTMIEIHVAFIFFIEIKVLKVMILCISHFRQFQKIFSGHILVEMVHHFFCHHKPVRRLFVIIYLPQHSFECILSIQQSWQPTVGPPVAYSRR